MSATICTPWQSQTTMALLWGPSLHRSFLSWNYLAALIGTILCSGEPAFPCPRGPSCPLSSVFLFLDAPKPFIFHGPALQDSLHPLATLAVFQVSLLCIGPLLSLILPKHLDYHLPLLSGRPSPLVHGPTPRFLLSPASGTPRPQGPVGPTGHHGPTVGPKWFPTG